MTAVCTTAVGITAVGSSTGTAVPDTEALGSMLAGTLVIYTTVVCSTSDAPLRSPRGAERDGAADIRRGNTTRLRDLMRRKAQPSADF